MILRGDRKVVLGKAVNILDHGAAGRRQGIALATKPPPKKRGE